MIFTTEEKNRLRRGEPVDVGSDRYMQCNICKRTYKINGFFHRFHFCATLEEQELIKSGKIIVEEQW